MASRNASLVKKFASEIRRGRKGCAEAGELLSIISYANLHPREITKATLGRLRRQFKLHCPHLAPAGGVSGTKFAGIFDIFKKRKKPKRPTSHGHHTMMYIPGKNGGRGSNIFAGTRRRRRRRR